MAAERLGVTPSLISKQVAELERRLGVKLLLRTTRKVEITDIGQRYYDYCIQILDYVEGAEDAARSLQKNPSGSVTLRAPHSLAVLYLPALISQIPRKNTAMCRSQSSWTNIPRNRLRRSSEATTSRCILGRRCRKLVGARTGRGRVASLCVASLFGATRHSRQT